MVAPKGREPSRHLHHSDDEGGFYVLDGRVTFYVGERSTWPIPARSSSCHMACPTPTFRDRGGPQPSIITPGGLEPFSRMPGSLSRPGIDASNALRRTRRCRREEMGRTWADTAPRWSVLPGHLRNSRGPSREPLIQSALWAEDVAVRGEEQPRANEVRRSGAGSSRITRSGPTARSCSRIAPSRA